MTTGSPDASWLELLERLHDGLRAWRRMGAISGALAAMRLLGRTARQRVRGAWIERHPLRVRPGELDRALGALTAVDALRGSALRALPTVGMFEGALASLAGDRCEDLRGREDLLRRADAAAAHVFDLLGSGPTELGLKIDWQRDFKSGRSWPLRHRSRLRISHPDASDIKVPWELSRFQHLPLLAGAYRVTHEERYLEEIGAQLQAWIEANPVELGANWGCTMDVAIRAANWVATLVLITGEEDAAAMPRAAMPWLEDVLASLLLHGRFIRSHLEWAQTRGNHYLSDVVGLLVVAAVFSGGEEGRAWARWAARETVSELAHQVREDGCDHEASIPYHRLVAELFVCGLQAAEALLPGSVPAWARERLDRMLEFTAAYTRPDGLAPQIGDADDGRLLPLNDYGTLEHRRHDHLFAQAGRRPPGAPGGHAAFPYGGWFVMRAGELYAIVRCGDVGIGGVGCHAHCDQLAFELCHGGQPLVVDPGAYLYTADLHARAAFRATAAHATLEIGAAEQNPIYVDRPFQLEDCTRAELVAWETDGAHATFVGRHHGYERLDPPAAHERRIEFDGDALTVTVTDMIRCDGSHPLRWSLPLAQCDVELGDETATARFPSGVRLSVKAPGLRFELTNGWCSPSYGVRHAAPVLRAERAGRSSESIAVCTLRVLPGSA